MPTVSDVALHSDLLAMALADPHRLATLVCTCARESPLFAARLNVLLADAVPAPLPSDPAIAQALPAAHPDIVEAVRSLRRVAIARSGVRYPAALAIDGSAIDLSVAQGGEYVIMGGAVVAFEPLTRLVATLPGDIPSRLATIGDEIAAQLGGRLSRRTMTRKASSTAILAVRPVQPHAEEADRPLVAAQALAAMWTPAAAIRRGRQEESLAYLARIVTAAQAGGGAQATAALAMLGEDFPDLLNACDTSSRQ